MERRSLHLLQLLLLFAFIHLIISSTATNSSRIMRVMKEVKENPLQEEAVQVSTESIAEQEEASRNDSVLEIEDYQGSGANNRHSPPSEGN
ncbi:hypothetical protein KFK09_024770 [Dendrobium nobile]|uniref:Uncharacterized protein n=1 Tax=Dendrobium nobile TaxID=94219 RepID=A0A8T3AEQ3_DENNO|nr:hypothetical protein KFK09_024770 [Dendrobium nobile]